MTACCWCASTPVALPSRRTPAAQRLGQHRTAALADSRLPPLTA
ncbi:MAG: hypothetical protein R3D85_07415 [Paracoccaceae bacterium]